MCGVPTHGLQPFQRGVGRGEPGVWLYHEDADRGSRRGLASGAHGGAARRGRGGAPGRDVRGVRGEAVPVGGRQAIPMVAGRIRQAATRAGGRYTRPHARECRPGLPRRLPPANGV